MKNITFTLVGSVFVALLSSQEVHAALVAKGFFAEFTSDNATISGMFSGDDGDDGILSQAELDTFMVEGIGFNSVMGDVALDLSTAFSFTFDDFNVAANVLPPFRIATESDESFFQLENLGTWSITGPSGGAGVSLQPTLFDKPVPEPSSGLLCGLGLAVLAGYGPRRRRAACL